MWQRLKTIIKKLFSRPVIETNGEQNDQFVTQYKDLNFNLTAIASNKLATLVVTESNVDVGKGKDEENSRISYMNDLIQKVWNALLPFCGYMFNKSHAAAYTFMAYQTTYLKAHYGPEYMAASASR